MKKLNLACGNIILDGWDNLDYESRAEGVIECNLNDKFPYENNSVDEILTSHFLEHLKLRTEAVPFLQECSRVLKPGGILSIIVPDFEVLTKVKSFDYHFNRFRNSKNALRWLVGATFGEGRTRWDYHVSGWFEERFKELGKGSIIVDPAAGLPIEVWYDMELVKIIRKWRPHSPYEITAIYKKSRSPAKETHVDGGGGGIMAHRKTSSWRRNDRPGILYYKPASQNVCKYIFRILYYKAVFQNVCKNVFKVDKEITDDILELRSNERFRGRYFLDMV